MDDVLDEVRDYIADQEETIETQAREIERLKEHDHGFIAANVVFWIMCLVYGYAGGVYTCAK